MKLIDLTGKRYGRLVVIARTENKGKYTAWLCKCDCGNECTVLGFHLNNGSTQSCGCIKKEQIKAVGAAHKTHGMAGSKLYQVYCNMKQRCYNPNTKSYNNYGGRGIAVCNEWLESFEAFYRWALLSGYKEGLTLERKNVNGNYEPNNCKWATRKEQNNNKRNNCNVTYNGETHTMAEWTEILKRAYKEQQGRA